MHLPFSFLYPTVLALALLVIPVLWFRRRRNPKVGHSNADMHKNLKANAIVAWLPSIFLAAFIITLVCALARPIVTESNKVKTIDTRDIVVAVDFSGSMTGQDVGPRPPGSTSFVPVAPNAAPDLTTFRRLDAAQDAAKAFIEKRKGDRVGLFMFDDEVYYHWPLTDDLKIVMRKADLINRRTGGGTNFEGPTPNDPRLGPIQAAIEHFKAYGQAKTKVLIIVSDGEAPISDQRFEELTTQMRELNMRIYVLGIGDSWTKPGGLSSMTEPLRKLVSENGGQCFGAADATQMQAAFDAINQLELSKVQFEDKTSFRDVYDVFLLVSLGFLALFLGSVFVTREVA